MADEIDDQTPVDEGAAEAPSAVQDPPEAAPSGHDWGEQASEPYAQRFPGGPAAMWEAIQQGTQKITQLSQAQQAPEAPVEPEEPWEPGQNWQAPAGVDPVFYGKVANNYQIDPVGTLRELVLGGDEYAIYAEQVYEALKAQTSEYRASRILAEIHGEQQQAQIEALLSERVNEQVTPLQNAATIGKVEAGISLAKGAIGDEDWAKFEPYLRAHTPAEGFPRHITENPELMRETLVKLREWQIFEEQRALNAAAAVPAPTPIPSRRGADATLSGNTASRPGDQDEIARIKESVRTTKVRLTD